MQKKGIFKTMADRQKFFQAVGAHYAALGGPSFGAYRSLTASSDAFANAKRAKLYERAIPTEMDFIQFDAGFQAVVDKRIAYQLEVAKYQTQMKDVLQGVDLLGVEVLDVKDVFALIAHQERATKK